MVLLIILLAMVHATYVPVSTQNCLAYGPNVVVLHGNIRRHTFAGPPNYESVARGDAREVVWLLHLPKSICVAGSEESSKEKKVTKIQLVFMEGQKQYALYRPLLNQRVTVTGTLFQWQTGHHHTRVLLTVDKMTKR